MHFTAQLSEKTEFSGLYSLPGEGLVAVLRQASTTYLFDKRGLQYRIMEKKRHGLDAKVEETALLRINNFTPISLHGE